MDALGRRPFLTRAVLGTATTVVGATALGALAPEAIADPGLDLDAGAVDPNFVEGRITGIKGSLLSVTGSDGSFHLLQLTAATSIWKLRPTTLDAARVGDGLYARGVRMPDGVLATDAVWLNIVNLTVHITSIGKDVMHLDHHGDRIVGHVVAGTTAAVYNGTPAVSDLGLLKVGQHAQVIGAWRPDTNEVDIATVFAAA
ncbi:MAG TPA: cell wall protein [Actinophytocola sp.]|uniref:cell wall protein n=1 Tax=Actinophytocola sp. TaxID=1872138 RepID=UPI002DDD3482|nr:cell wall protein [Actinophytocola sp.]HEV2781261.1 cell wall protein [Actinophytocola sp.]